MSSQTSAGSTGLLLPSISGIVLMLWAGSHAAAQTVNRGPEIVGLSVSDTYFAQSVPDGIATYGDVFRGSGTSLTSAASLKWTRTSARTFLNLRVLSAYGSRFGDLNSRTWNQALSFTYSRKLAGKWTMNWSGSGQIMNFDEAIFADSTLTQVASSAINFDDLAGAVLRGKSSDPELNSTAYGSLYPEPGLETFLFGQRTATAAAQATLTYARSPRLSVSLVAGGMLVRGLKDPSYHSNLVYPKVNTTTAGIDAVYSLSPRTQVGVSANMARSEFRGSSTFLTNTFSGSVDRTMSRRWFLQASVGFGSEIMGDDRHLNNRYSAGLGFRTFSSTVLVTYERGLDDPYAVALATLEHARGLTGTWRFARPGSPWWINSAFTQRVAIYRGVPGTNTWLTAHTVGRRISRNYSVMVQFTAARVGAKRYIEDGRQYQLEQTGIRTTFIWSPQTAPRSQ